MYSEQPTMPACQHSSTVVHNTHVSAPPAHVADVARSQYIHVGVVIHPRASLFMLQVCYTWDAARHVTVTLPEQVVGLAVNPVLLLIPVC